jgi:hypothetical protein
VVRTDVRCGSEQLIFVGHLLLISSCRAARSSLPTASVMIPHTMFSQFWSILRSIDCGPGLTCVLDAGSVRVALRLGLPGVQPG